MRLADVNRDISLPESNRTENNVQVTSSEESLQTSSAKFFQQMRVLSLCVLRLNEAHSTGQKAISVKRKLLCAPLEASTQFALDLRRLLCFYVPRFVSGALTVSSCECLRVCPHVHKRNVMLPPKFDVNTRFIGKFYLWTRKGRNSRGTINSFYFTGFAQQTDCAAK